MINSAISKHPSIFYAADVQAICSPLGALGISYFGHARIDKVGNVAGICSHPEFMTIYLQKKYYNYDIHMSEFHQPEQYILWDSVAIAGQTLDMENDFNDFQLGHTFTIYKEHKTYTDYYHFSSKLGNEATNQSYLDKLYLLKQFIHYFNDRIHQNRELLRAYDISFATEKNVGKFITNDLILPKDNIALNSLDIERFYIGSDSYITKREFECLKLLAEGNTFESAAAMLGITTRTVKAHVSHIKDKFRCDNQFQLGMLYQKLAECWGKK